MKQVFAPVISSCEVSPGVQLIWIEAPQIASVAIPGQFVTVHCGEDVLLRRPFSIHRIDEGKLAILFAVVGQGTEWLSGRVEGESLSILGPLGNGFRIDQDSRNLLLVAGGIGIAPLVFLAEKAVAEGFFVRLMHGTATASQYSPVMMEGVEYIRITEDGSTGEKGLVTDFLPAFALSADQVFACGPVPMYRALSALEAQLRGKSVQILMEQVMGCGVGACMGCTVATGQGMKMVCRDGPAFDLREIEWECQ
ncbi:MAG: dihydroorotate dehydrogenase electron transfer subunit [Chloroflexota bacterium]|nr:dihydroorotate dehydrogenase electron transfer subunit [Chloroflexota bacterium]